jgi:hypothetical protein
MLFLNGMRPFGGRPNTKTMWAWPKADNIISFKAGCYIRSRDRMYGPKYHSRHTAPSLDVWSRV